MVYVFYALAALLILQGIGSLIEGFQFLAFVRRALRAPLDSFTPKLTIIAPCKGIDPELEENLSALFNQDYPDYEIIFAIASSDDAARPVIERVISKHKNRIARLVIAEPSLVRSEKVNNLLCALDDVSDDSQALVFVDSDARVRSGWLRSLVAPLRDARVGAATGYRWYLPARGGFFSALLSAWNGSVATTLGDHSRNFAWGGSTVILKETFERIGVRESWQRAVSDDYALTRAVQRAGLRIHFEPRCLNLSREDVELRALLEFTTRQVIITRAYRPRVWWIGLISQILYCAIFFGGAAFLVVNALRGGVAIAPLVMLSIIYLLGSIKGALRIIAASEALPQSRKDILSLWWMYVLLWPLVSLVFLYNFIKSATTRRIKWRGVVYEMCSPDDTRVLN